MPADGPAGARTPGAQSPRFSAELARYPALVHPPRLSRRRLRAMTRAEPGEAAAAERRRERSGRPPAGPPSRPCRDVGRLPVPPDARGASGGRCDGPGHGACHAVGPLDASSGPRIHGEDRRSSPIGVGRRMGASSSAHGRRRRIASAADADTATRSAPAIESARSPAGARSAKMPACG